jgi:predicted amidohydrolase
MKRYDKERRKPFTSTICAVRPGKVVFAIAGSKLNLSLLQMNVVAGDPAQNVRRMETMLNEAVRAAKKPDVLLLPELWNTGYALDRIDRLADAEGKTTRSLLSDFCRVHQVNIVAGSVAVKTASGVTNTVYVFDRSGRVSAEYAKIHLFRLMDEDKYLTAGNRPGETTIDGIPAGLMVCYDIRFPELCRNLALRGAKLLFVPAQWPHPRMHHWRTLLMARAIENQMFVAACNRVGTSGGSRFFGHSMIIDPWGEVVAEGGEQEQIVAAEIDLAEIGRVRNTIPVFEDRRPDVYENRD